MFYFSPSPLHFSIAYLLVATIASNKSTGKGFFFALTLVAEQRVLITVHIYFPLDWKSNKYQPKKTAERTTGSRTRGKRVSYFRVIRLLCSLVCRIMVGGVYEKNSEAKRERLQRTRQKGREQKQTETRPSATKKEENSWKFMAWLIVYSKIMKMYFLQASFMAFQLRTHKNGLFHEHTQAVILYARKSYFGRWQFKLLRRQVFSPYLQDANTSSEYRFYGQKWLKSSRLKWMWQYLVII